MACIRTEVASAIVLLVGILAKPVHSWEPPRSLRGFRDSAEVSVTNLALGSYPCNYLCSAVYCNLQVSVKSAGRKLTQSSNLAGGAYNIQSAGRLGSCSSYLSIQKCSEGDTVDLYSSDDGSGRQQWQFVSAGGTNLYGLQMH